MLRILLTSLFFCLAGAGLAAATDAVVCPAEAQARVGALAAGLPPTDWTAPGCETVWLSRVDPTDRMIWVRTELDMPDTDAPGLPVALLLSGRFSARLWVNGTEIAGNGLPGPDAASESPGRIDSARVVPDGLLRPGTNEIVLLASAHSGRLDLIHPFHNLQVMRVVPLDRSWVSRLSPVMIALGFLLAGLAYFGGLAAAGVSRRDTLTLAGLSALAAGQLLAESLRVLWAYPYPVHDLRLLAIAGLSASFGMLACLHVSRRLWPEGLCPVMAAAIALSLGALVLQPGFDGKASFAMLGPLCVALSVALGVALIASLRARARRPRALAYAAALTLFVGTNLLWPNLFLDAVFFYLVAALLGLLLVEQALERSRDQSERLAETARADRLALVLETLDPDGAAPPLTLRSAGRVEQIPLSDIIRLQSADGYAEIVLTSGRTVLHSQSLSALEKALPASFLKVHRSHIVNTTHVRALDRDSTGTGSLVLDTGESVPVSRRILPRVRQALG